MGKMDNNPNLQLDTPVAVHNFAKYHSKYVISITSSIDDAKSWFSFSLSFKSSKFPSKAIWHVSLPAIFDFFTSGCNSCNTIVDWFKKLPFVQLKHRIHLYQAPAQVLHLSKNWKRNEMCKRRCNQRGETKVLNVCTYMHAVYPIDSLAFNYFENYELPYCIMYIV